MSTTKRDIQRGLAFIRMGCSILQDEAKEKNLAAFNASQQRIKSRHSEAQSVSNAIAATVTINAVISENDKEADHV